MQMCTLPTVLDCVKLAKHQDAKSYVVVFGRILILLIIFFEVVSREFLFPAFGRLRVRKARACVHRATEPPQSVDLGRRGGLVPHNS
jgi:hypothetical protein